MSERLSDYGFERLQEGQQVSFWSTKLPFSLRIRPNGDLVLGMEAEDAELRLDIPLRFQGILGEVCTWNKARPR